MEDHFKTCVNSIVCCEFKNIGCQQKMKRREVASHMKENASEHVKLINTQMVVVSNYLVKKDPMMFNILNSTPAKNSHNEGPTSSSPIMGSVHKMSTVCL